MLSSMTKLQPDVVLTSMELTDMTGVELAERIRADFRWASTAVIVMTHENGCITTIDNSRQAVYGYDQRVEAFGSLTGSREAGTAGFDLLRHRPDADSGALEFLVTETLLAWHEEH